MHGGAHQPLHALLQQAHAGEAQPLLEDLLRDGLQLVLVKLGRLRGLGRQPRLVVGERQRRQAVVVPLFWTQLPSAQPLLPAWAPPAKPLGRL